MKRARRVCSVFLMFSWCFVHAQQSASGSANIVVPPLVNFSGALTDVDGKPLNGVTGVTFSLYKDEQGGSPLWIETQNVQPDKYGHYTVQLGASSSQGLPADLFSSGEARWLGVQPEGQPERPRVMLLSVPYAMKAGDATTIGGLPPSAFVIANSSNSHSTGKKSNPATETQDFIPLFIDSSGDLGNSILYESGGSEVGIGTTTPSATLEVNGTGKFDGLVSFSGSQTFPGTLTGITAGTGISVTGSKSNPTVGINTTFANEFYAQLGAANTFTNNQTVNGNLTATSSGVGVLGTSTGASSYGVEGTGPNVGLFGSGTGAGGIGVDGHGTFQGVKGIASATSGSSQGVYGQTSSSAGYGVEGTSPNVGVYGTSSNVGVYGAANGASGLGGIDIGVWGDTGGPEGPVYVGVLGTANENSAAAFYNNSSPFETLYAQNNAESESDALVVYTHGGYFDGTCSIDVSGNLSCSGTVNSVVSADNGARKVELHALQSPDDWFEDAGSGQLSNGSASIALDPTFAQTVNTGVEYHVFLTPNGDCKGLYVSQKSAASFEVHELGGGTSSIAFDYRIMAKRRGYENVRLADVTERYKKTEQQEQLRSELMEQHRAARRAERPIDAAVPPQSK